MDEQGESCAVTCSRGPYHPTSSPPSLTISTARPNPALPATLATLVTPPATPAPQAPPPPPPLTPPLPPSFVHKITEEIEKYTNSLKEEEEEDPEVASRHRAQTTAFEQKAEEELTEMEDID